MNPTVAVILAGGSGTRLYPASRSDRPKPLCSLGPETGDRSLLARTLDRADFADRRVVLTGPDHADRVRDHLADHADARDVETWVEPAARDTGPALVYAAGRAREAFDDPVLVCLPSDHHVAGDFGAVAERAATVAVETGGLVCLGVEPDRPATGYGYLQPRREADGYASVAAFTEKPDADRARELLAEGALWNVGVFAWTPTALLSAAADTELAPLAAAFADPDSTADDANSPQDADPAAAATGDADSATTGDDPDSSRDADPDLAVYDSLDPVSVDHAVLEHAANVFVVPAREIEWDDLGTWDALARVLSTDADGNAVAGDALTVDTDDSVIAAEDAHVTAVGVSDLVVAAVGDRVLVVPRDETERVREAVERLRETGAF